MTDLQNNPVYKVAELDFQPHLVDINYDAIRALPRPEASTAATHTQLEGSRLHANPQAYIPYLVAMNVLNYQFWDLAEHGTFVRYQHEGKVGALAMQAAMLKTWCDAIEKGDLPSHTRDQLELIIGALRPRIEREGVAFIFGDIPNPASRKKLLLEVLDTEKLAQAYDHLFSRLTNTLTLGWQDAQFLADLFPNSYGDRYLKKAQLTLMFIAGEWNVEHPHHRCNLDVSACADYQLPKVMHAMGILRYAKEVEDTIKACQLVSDDVERALRAATVLGCRAMAEHLQVTIEEVDFQLWLARNQAREAKFHLMKTTAY